MRTLVINRAAHDQSAAAIRKALAARELGDEMVHAAFGEAERTYLQTEAELVIVFLWPHPETGLDVIRRLRGTVKGHVLAAGPVAEPKMILRAMQVGADVFLDQADLEAELDAGLSRLRFKEDTSGPAGRAIAVLSASGGCGASTLAVNVAAALAGTRGTSLLIDLHPGRGDLAALLDLRPQYTLADVCRHQDRLDRAMLGKMLVSHPSGIHLLGSSSAFDDARAVSPRGVGHALALGRKLFAEVVADLEDCFHDEQLVVLRQAAGILLVCRLDFTSLRNARHIIDHLTEVGIPRHRVKVVINQHGQPNELPVDEAESAVAETLHYFVPYDPRTIFAANNTGVPAVLKDPAGKVSQSVLRIARIDFERPSGPHAALEGSVMS